MDSSVEIAIIGAITVICTGFFAWVQGFQAAARQRADWVRQDIVMKRAEETVVKAQETADLLSKNTAKVSIQAAAMLKSNLSIEEKVDVVKELAVTTKGLAITTHRLVNSALTEIKQDLLAGLIRELDMMVKLGSTTQEIALQEAKISDARTELADRTQTTIVMENQRRAAIVEKERDIARRDPAAGG